jgi:hypothetical protein
MMVIISERHCGQSGIDDGERATATRHLDYADDALLTFKSCEESIAC